MEENKELENVEVLDGDVVDTTDDTQECSLLQATGLVMAAGVAFGAAAAGTIWVGKKVASGAKALYAKGKAKLDERKNKKKDVEGTTDKDEEKE